MIKLSKKIMVVSMALLLLVGCSSSTKSYTLKAGTGDQVKITVEDSYRLKQNAGQFDIKKNKKTVSQGVFINQTNYQRYVSSILENSKIKVLDTKKEDKYSYYFYKIKENKENEYNYIIWLKGSNTGMILKNTKSKKAAQDIFEKLTFEIKH